MSQDSNPPDDSSEDRDDDLPREHFGSGSHTSSSQSTSRGSPRVGRPAGDETSPDPKKRPLGPWRKAGIGALALAVVGGGLFFFVIPQYVDRSKNGLYPLTTENIHLPVPPLHKDLFVADLHADTLLWNRDILKESHFGHWDVPRMVKGNGALQTLSVVTKSPKGQNYERNSGDTDALTTLMVAQRWPVATWSSLKQRAFHQSQKVKEAVVAAEGQLIWIQKKQDLEELRLARAEDSSVVGVWLSLEGSQALEDSLDAIDEFQSWGYRMMAPTHFFDTAWAGSRHGEGKGGLTEKGREWLRRLEEKSIIIDGAHASEATLRDLLKYATKPFLISHGGVKAVCDNNRNLSDEMLKAVAQKGGLIGVGFWSDATCGKSVASVVNSITYLVKLIGADSVALGSDFDGYVSSPIDAADLGQITAQLQKVGVPEPTIRKVMGENVYQFLLKHLPSEPAGVTDETELLESEDAGN